MRVLFDQATPVPIRRYLEGHDVRTAAQQGWVLGLQQWPSLRPNVERVVEAITAAKPGSYTQVEFP
jgi:hypothetical protein